MSILENKDFSIAVLIPCYNEELTISKVVRDFKEHLPNSSIYVYDNNSNDNTRAEAENAGAIVRREELQGKGNVVRRMFADIEADIYILVDGDNTYDAASAPTLIETILDGPYDLVNVARRVYDSSKSVYRPGHQFGNWMLTFLVRSFFGKQFVDILSGYKLFSRRFVKSFPSLSTGFEIETELAVHALELNMPIKEVHAPFRERPEGSKSKIRTFSDGLRILRTIGILLKEEKPFKFFGIISLVFALSSIILAYPVFIEYLETGLVPRFPTAILSTGLMLIAFLSLTCGLILDTVTLSRREMKRLFYLSYDSFIIKS